MKKIALFVIVCLMCQLGQSQWLTNGTTLYYSGGRVGIGTSGPLGALQVIGDTTYLQGLNLGFGAGTAVIKTDAPSKEIAFQVGNTEMARLNASGNLLVGWLSQSNTAFRLDVNGGARVQSVSLGLGTGLAVVNTDASTKPISFQIGNTEYARLLSNGSFGIGTTDTKGYLLAVNGSAIFTSAWVKPYANWPDYVFNKDYQLPSLASVAEYIKAHNHLPDLPSADSVAKKGIDLGGGQMTLLKKIEELTLYLIQQNEDLSKVTDQLAKLKNEREEFLAQNKILQDQNKKLEEQKVELQVQSKKIDQLEQLIMQLTKGNK